MPLREFIRLAVERTDLSRAQAAAAIDAMLEGTAPHAQMAALLVALRMKGETPDEVAGAAEAMRRRALMIQVSQDRLIDTCGTGGDGRQTFNISTTAAFVAAGAGARRQILGVPAPQFVMLLARTLAELGCDRAFVVHGHGGVDEIATSGPTMVAEVRGREVREFAFSPEDAGLPLAPLEALRGGEAAE